MLGRHHLTISLATGGALLAPYLDNNSTLVLFMMFGVAIGSLTPDADSQDSAIFHEKVKGLRGNLKKIVNGLFAPIFPIFGYTTKYLIYYPSVFILRNTVLSNYDVEAKHRKFLHSFLGISVTTLVMGLYIGIITALFNRFNLLYLLLFLLAYLFGSFLHLLEDSATKTGIAFNYPFSKKRLKGELSTSAHPEDVKTPRRFLYSLGILLFLSYIVSAGQIVKYPDWQITVVFAIIITIMWYLFLFAVAKAKIE